MKRIFTVIITLGFSFLITACFPDFCVEPQVEENVDFHNLTIPSDGKTYEIPFKFTQEADRHTRLSIHIDYHQIRSRMLIDDCPSEIFDAYYNDVVGYNLADTAEGNVLPATFVVNVPSNETSKARSIVAQISIDRCENYSLTIEESDEHDWGEWITILDGIQEGNEMSPN